MSYSQQERDIVISGWESGVATSPHQGLGALKGVNIDTAQKEAMCSFARVKQSQTGTSGTLTQVNTNTVSVSGITLKVGQIITITDAGTTGLTTPYTALTAVECLVVGGGGGGGILSGGNVGGGGGAGELKYNAALAVTAQAYTVTVGAGGASATSGSNSVFSTITAVGGGKGGSNASGTAGGSGGGAAQGIGYVGGASTASGGGFGNAGGASSNTTYAGGGGGAGAVGADGGNPTGGAGGIGKSYSISGAATYYAGGGGGAGVAGGAGGLGGGGAGNGTNNGTANTGGGGGGSDGATAGAGGSGVVIISYPTGSVSRATGGTITTSGGNTIHTFTTSGTFTVLPTQTGNYYYLSTGKLYGGTSTTGSLPPSTPDSVSAVTGITAGSATFTITYPLGSPIQKATETYYKDTTQTLYYRYYILDDLGSIWCHDTATLSNWDTPDWFFVGNAGAGASGLAAFNGWLTVSNGYTATYWKLTSLLGSAFSNTVGTLGFESTANHVMLNGSQGKLYGTDGHVITSLFPNTSLISGGANVQSYCSYTASTTDGTVTAVIGGTIPTTGTFSPRIPALFFTDGTKPTALSTAVIYYIQWRGTNPFYVYAAASGGSPLDIATGAVGKQYFNTFDPTDTSGLYGGAMYTFSAQRLNLPFYETATCLAELGNTVVIGGKGNTIYPWNQVSTLPQDLLFLPENGTVNIITVNNTGYIFAGRKGNIYITNGSSISAAISVPDYAAGIEGTPKSYIEPYFTWGDAMYCRGKVFFSILDQTSIKAGNCGGIWSFVPMQNFFSGEDVGLALRLENQNSYGTYSGLASVLLPSQDQGALGTQYWSGWYSSITSPTYGIDFTDTIPQTAVIETDLIPTGTMLGKRTFEQIEYKMGAPLVSGETVTIKYRQNGTDAFTSCGTVITESDTGMSGFFPANFENGQWLQLQITLTPLASASSSFCRLFEVRVR